MDYTLHDIMMQMIELRKELYSNLEKDIAQLRKLDDSISTLMRAMKEES